VPLRRTRHVATISNLRRSHPEGRKSGRTPGASAN